MSRPHLVLVNATHAKSGGARVHLLEVLPRLARLRDPEVRYLVLARADQVADLRAAGVEPRLVAAPHHFALSFAWDQTVLPLLALRLRAGLVFSPANYGPWLLGRRCMLLLRNALDAGAASSSRGEAVYWWIQDKVTRWSVRTAGGGMVVSESFGKALAARFRIPEAWFVANPHGHASMFRPDPEPGETGGNAGRYVLVVGDLYPHKNLEGVLEATAEVRRTRPDVSLRVVGAPLLPHYADRLRARAAELGFDAETLAGPRPQAALPALYRTAAAVLCLSSAESFCMPQVEAMACGAPLVVSDLPVFREISGDAAVYADPADVASMARAIGAVLDDPALAARLSRTGRERAPRFSWDRCARTVHDEARRRFGLPPLGTPSAEARPLRSQSSVARNATPP